MENQTVFIKRYPSKGEFPETSGDYHTDYGIAYFIHSKKKFYQGIIIVALEYWFEEIELPSEEDIRDNLLEQGSIANYALYQSGYEDGANFILNKLKGETR